MGEKTGIQWTDHTFNPWWGCAHVSPGCDHCYAETLAARFGTAWGKETPRRLFGVKHWQEPVKWNVQAQKQGVKHKVFCASMADVFEDRRDLDAERAKLWRLIDKTPWLIWQILTKRPQNITRLVPLEWLERWPSNVWPGASVEDSLNEKRAKFLNALPTCTAFLSIEPMIGNPDVISMAGTNIRWAIFGGESGHGARRMEIDWVREGIVACRHVGIAPFVKQLGVVLAHELGLADKKGGNISEWPKGVQVREFPL